MVEMAKGLESLFGTLGFPVAIVVVLLVSIWFAARKVRDWVEAKDREAQAREVRLAARLDHVQTQTVELLKDCVDKSTRALEQNTSALEQMLESHNRSGLVLVRVDETLKLVRRQLSLGSGAQGAIADRG